MKLSHYHFASTVRQGLAVGITDTTEAQRDAARAEIDVSLHVERRSKITGQWDPDIDPIRQTLQLRGPGDIVDFEDSIVVRTDPKPESGNFEPNYFPTIDFADPDFPWRYTPAAAAESGLTPWITLVVLVAEEHGDTEKEFTKLARAGHQRQVIAVHSVASLPDLRLARRWAHVQATTGTSDLSAAELADHVQTDPGSTVSRLVCARRLQPGTLYEAFVVPTFKLGWAAGIDTPDAHADASGAGALDLAWDHDIHGSARRELPVYHSWTFRTSKRGDFEHLVRLLEPRKLEGLGLRTMDCERPRYGLTVTREHVEDPADSHMLELEGALQSLTTDYTPWGKDIYGPLDEQISRTAEPFQEELVDLLAKANPEQLEVHLPRNFDSGVVQGFSVLALTDGKSVRVVWRTATDTVALAEWGPERPDGGFQYLHSAQLAEPDTCHRVMVSAAPETRYYLRLTVADPVTGETVTTPDVSFILHLPAVVPPIYGRWHAGETEVSATSDRNGWLDVLNLDPRHRAAGGLGAEVIRRNQEALMASAWDQAGAIEAANEILRRAQFGREISIGSHDRLSEMSLEDFLKITGPAQKRVTRSAGPAKERTTIPTELSTETWIPPAILAPAFRRIARLRGPIRRRQNRGQTDVPVRVLERLADRHIRPVGDAPVPAGTPTPCEVTRRTYQYEESKRRTGSPTDEDDGQPVFGPNSPAGPTTGGIEPIPQPWWSIPVPPDALRFCDGPLVCEHLRLGTDAAAEHPLIVVACDAFADLLTPTAYPTSKSSVDREFLEELREDILAALDPRQTIKERTKIRLDLPPEFSARFEDEERDPLDPLMMHPDFPQPMYKPLRDISQDLVLPGIEKVPQNTIGLLETNRRFLESYMVGLNHEFAGELLWHGYPGDQRGSYFRQFWDITEYVPRPGESVGGVLTAATQERLKDIRRLHLWGDTQLGKNESRFHHSDRADEDQENLVVIVRGDLFKRYPNAVVYSVDAAETQDETLVPELTEFGVKRPGDPVYPIFKGSLGADLVFFGFPFTETEARGRPRQHPSFRLSDDDPRAQPPTLGKFFVIEERVSEARFGLDSASESIQAQQGLVLNDWSGLDWGHFQLAESDCAGKFLDGSPTTISGPRQEVWDGETSAALIARITLQKPVRLAIHADQMLPESPSNGGASVPPHR
ncbi:MAG: hypothetical protein GY788_29250 [bacterium]|nr:hypothetical protein [bacterium]